MRSSKDLLLAVLAEELERKEAEAHLLAFAKRIYPTHIWNWHHERICEALEAVERGEVKRLIITVPPRHSKSTLVSQLFPSWYFGRHPDKAVILASYNDGLAASFGGSVRDIIGGPNYRTVFDVRVSSSNSARGEWLIEGSPERASMLSSGVGGGATGYGANVLIIDDYLKNAEDASSSTIRQKQWEWYTSTARTRLQPNGAIVICATRWHSDDLIGRILASESADEWTVIHFPAISEQGEALWPDFYSIEDLEAIRKDVGETVFQALFQGRPVPVGGNMLKSEWLQVAPMSLLALSKEWILVYGVDPSTGVGEDYTAICKMRWSPAHGRAIVVDVIVKRWDFPTLVKRLEEEYAIDKPAKIMFESVAFSAWGAQHLTASTKLPVVESKTKKSKEIRLTSAGALGTQFETGRILLSPIETPGIVEFRKQWAEFPAGKHDDALDSVEIASRGLVLKENAPTAPQALPFGRQKAQAAPKFGGMYD